MLEQWLKADGDARKAGAVPAFPDARCDGLGCTLTLPDGRRVALVTDKRAFPEDCARADILISRQSASPGCAAAFVLDRAFLAAHGAAALRLTREGAHIVTTRRPGEAVPWRPVALANTDAPNIVPAAPIGRAKDAPGSLGEGPGEGIGEGTGEELQ